MINFETTQSLPLFDNNDLTREERKERYLHQGLSFYNGIKTLTSEEYKNIMHQFNNGNKEVLNNLIEKSIYIVIVATANVYSKYDI